MTEAPTGRPKPKGSLRILDDAVLDGFSLNDIKCRSCSGYGNCGYKSTYLVPGGGIASICMQRRHQMRCERDGVPFDPADISA
ncbi:MULTISPECIES: hypothetical protein [unclassified Adlercreutzia]|uniref:hypothetical protein n=1 Tax=unclassified Adlercreutzia TaxID=2636013 RepID=UPI0013EB0BF0|nr:MULTISPECIES: hypothetical protein [unclassified Adlercreutzia]